LATVNVHEAKTHLSKLLARVAAGEEIIIAKAGQPIARLSPVKQVSGKRKLGNAAGKAWMAEDFDAPLPEDLQELFER
jgi:prevent-host-death family protein